MPSHVSVDTVFQSFTDPEKLQAETNFFIRFLDAIQLMPAILENQDRIRSRWSLRAGSSFLDVGCGTGHFLVDTAPQVGAAGRAVGLDQSEALLQIAIERASAANVCVETHVGDAMNLPFASGTFDAVRSERLLQYLPDPQIGVNEMTRVAKPGGWVFGTELDWDTIVVDLPGLDRSIWRRMLAATGDNSGNAWMGRELKRTFVDAGLRDVEVEPFVNLVLDFEVVWEFLGMRQAAERAAAIGVVSAEERDQFIDAATSSANRGAFFCGFTLFTVYGRA